MKKNGFTLVELMLVVVIIGILVAIAIPIYDGAIENSRVKTFESNHSLIVSAINMYTSAHNGKYPPDLNALDSYLLNDKGLTHSIDNFTDNPRGATYVYTYTASTNKFTLTSKYKSITYTFSK